jgi:hypothetical protein
VESNYYDMLLLYRFDQRQRNQPCRLSITYTILRLPRLLLSLFPTGSSLLGDASLLLPARAADPEGDVLAEVRSLTGSAAWEL